MKLCSSDNRYITAPITINILIKILRYITNNYNKYTTQYLKKKRYSENEIWSVKKIQHEKCFSSKNHAEIEAGRLVPNFVLFFKKVLYEVKENG